MLDLALHHYLVTVWPILIVGKTVKTLIYYKLNCSNGMFFRYVLSVVRSASSYFRGLIRARYVNEKCVETVVQRLEEF